jgi:hypothetical protein
LRELDSSLLPHQIRQFQLAADLKEISQAGLVCALCYGNLGRRLNFNSEQRKNLEETANLCVKTISEKTWKLELKIVSRTIASLKRLGVIVEISPECFNAFEQRVDVDTYLLGLLFDSKS